MRGVSGVAGRKLQMENLSPRFPCYTDPVSNLTITIDAELLKRARIRALEQGTSVNAVLRTYLESYAGHDDARRTAMRLVLDLAGKSEARLGAWSRDDLHER